MRFAKLTFINAVRLERGAVKDEAQFRETSAEKI